MTLLRRIAEYINSLLSPHPQPEVGRHGSANLLSDGNYESVEAWLRAEIAAWQHAARHTNDPVKQRTYVRTSWFYEERLTEHLARRETDDG